MADAVLTSARFGDADELRAALQGVDAKQKDVLVNFVQDGSENTPLHMGTNYHDSEMSMTSFTDHCCLAACANGHADCVKELLANGARHLPNASGNLPLRTRDWHYDSICARVWLTGGSCRQTGRCRTSTSKSSSCCWRACPTSMCLRRTGLAAGA